MGRKLQVVQIEVCTICTKKLICTKYIPELQTYLSSEIEANYKSTTTPLDDLYLNKL